MKTVDSIGSNINYDAQIVFVNSIFPELSETFLFDQYSLLLKNKMPMAIVSSNQDEISLIHPNMRAIQSQVDYLCNTTLRQIVKKCSWIHFSI